MLGITKLYGKAFYIVMVGKWDLLTNEVTKHRFSKHWNTRFDEQNYFRRSMGLNLEFTHDVLGKFRMISD